MSTEENPIKNSGRRRVTSRERSTQHPFVNAPHHPPWWTIKEMASVTPDRSCTSFLAQNAKQCCDGAGVSEIKHTKHLQWLVASPAWTAFKTLEELWPVAAWQDSI
jgi:hypothetical protein